MDYKVKKEGLTLYTKDKYLEEDIKILPDESLLPTGELEITENGTYDVTDYASAKVTIEGSGSSDEVTLQNLIDEKEGDLTRLFYNLQRSDVSFLKDLDFSSVKTADYLFASCENIESFPELTFTDNLTRMNYMFQGCRSLTELPFLDTKNVTSFQSTFQGCMNLTRIPTYDTRNVKSLYWTFAGCSNLTEIPALDVRNVTNFSLFYSASTTDNKLVSILMYGMKTSLEIKQFRGDVEAVITILSNCQVVDTTQTLTIGSWYISNMENVYVKETGVEPYEGITLRPCVICESTDEGAILAIDYFNQKGWTLA